MSDGPLFIYSATYANADDAQSDYQVLRDLHSDELVGTYDVAILTKDDKGKIHVEKHEKPTQHGAWTGIAVGALVGILFPPSILADAVIGGVIGGLMGHLARGMSREDIKSLGDLIDTGQAALVIIGESQVKEQLDQVLTRAQSSVDRETEVDAEEFQHQLKLAELEIVAV